MRLKITATQQIPFGAPTALDAKQNPTTIQDPVVTSTNPAVLSVTRFNDDGSGLAVAVGPLGLAELVLEGDADLGDGVVPVQGRAEIEVGPGKAVTVVMNLGAPEEQPAV